jgi:hypothetical protein
MIKAFIIKKPPSKGVNDWMVEIKDPHAPAKAALMARVIE